MPRYRLNRRAVAGGAYTDAVATGYEEILTGERDEVIRDYCDQHGLTEDAVKVELVDWEE